MNTYAFASFNGLKLFFRASIFSAILLALFPFRAQAVSYDAVADFSSSVNTSTSTWSYRYKPGSVVRDGNYTLLPGFTGTNGSWNPTNPGSWTVGGNVPEIGVNQTGGDVTYTSGAAFTWPDNTMLVHPGNLELVVLSWLSPTSSFFDIDFSFTDLDPNGGNGILWYVDENATNLSAGLVFNNTSGMVTLNNIFVNAGDRINFIVDPNGDYHFDSTKITATITSSAVGTPDTGSTLMLLFSALVTIAGLKSFALRFA